MAYNAKNLWKSKRLVFRGLQFPEDEAFFMELRSDPHLTSMSHGSLIKPPNQSTLEEMKTEYGKQMLACIICLPKEETPSTTTASTTGAETSEGPPSKSLEAWMTKQRAKFTAIGIISCSPASSSSGIQRGTSIGVNILEPFQGKGYGPEAIEWITGWAFDHAGMHRVNIGGFEYNERALRLYEKLGFVLEGRVRKALWRGGQWWDIIELAVLEDEWRERKPST